jgi:hypothetical protein
VEGAIEQQHKTEPLRNEGWMLLKQEGGGGGGGGGEEGK